MEKRTLSEMIEHLYRNVQKMEMDQSNKVFILGNLIAMSQKADELKSILEVVKIFMEARERNKS